MATKQDVEGLLDRGLTATQIAKQLGCNSAYVRATLGRNGWRGRVKGVLRSPAEIAEAELRKRDARIARAAKMTANAERRAAIEAQRRAAPHALELLAVLKEIEWSGTGDADEGGLIPACPYCDVAAEDGVHADDCRLASAIAKAEGRT